VQSCKHFLRVLSSSHLVWIEDALGVYFAHSKTDQGGDRPKDARHCYANPLQPPICVILSLAIYLACCPFAKESKSLFSGSNQYERYSKCLARLLNKEEVLAELKSRGLSANEIGSHSTRKGVTTFVSSGSTSCPSQAAINIRAGWAMGGVQDTYLRYEAAGDMYVGRTAAGLPQQSAEFAVLPPHFANADEVADVVLACFPNAPISMNPIIQECLASLVFHADFLRANLDPKHRLFSTPLFTNASLVPSLLPKVVCGRANEKTLMRATGLPPHISLLESMSTCAAKIEAVIPAIDAAVPKIVEGVTVVLEERSIAASTVTRNGLKDMLTQILDEAGVYKAVEAMRKPPHTAASVLEPLKPSPSLPAYMWAGKFHLVPENFAFPNGSTLAAWQSYMAGDSSKGYPPLRKLSPLDMPSKNMRKRLSDFKFIWVASRSV